MLNPLSDNLTPAHQLALSVLYESGSPSLGDYTQAYYDEIINRFHKDIPALRDETVFLDGKPDEYYVAAIRAGDEWFVGGINSILETDITVDFSFLGDGEYEAELFTDDKKGDSLVRTAETFVKGDTLSLKMLENGGVIMRLSPKK